MELLNNIWIALSTSNEELLNILLFPVTFIENSLILLLFTLIMGISSNIKQKMTYILLMTIISTLTMHFVPNPFNIFINCFSMIPIAYFVFKESIFKTCTSILLSVLIFNLISALILNPYITILNINTDQLTSIPIYRITYILTLFIFVYSLILIFRRKPIKLSILDDLDKKTKRILIANLIIGSIAIFIQAITLFYYVEILPLFITFSSFLALLFYFGLSIYSLSRVFKLTITTKQLESAKEYNNTLRILHDNVRSFKHDFDNIVTTIGGFVKTNDMDGLKNYYSELEDDCQRVNNLYILNPEVINNDGIYNLLTKKYNEADSKDIKVTISFLLDLSKLNMKVYEFSRILGVLLDNAIEASSECEEKVIHLTFRDDYKNHRQLIIVENTYKDKNVDIDKIFEKGISGKQNHSGLGLWEVRKLIKKNNNVNLFTNKNDEFFKQQLEIYY